MYDSENATDERIVGGERTPRVMSDLLTVNDVAAKINCSSRSVYRLADAGRMPRPVKLGGLVRWRRDEIDTWIADGCPGCRHQRKGVRS